MMDEKSLYKGILLVDKEEGISSFDVIRKLKPILPRGLKIGHGGTLDPFATGLVIVLMDKATKLSGSLMSLDKEYDFTITLGYETDTLDPTGSVVYEKDFNDELVKNKINSVIGEYKGESQQMPPQYSAKKVQGKSAYKYARKGKKVKLKPKLINVKRLDITNVQVPEISFTALVTSGTYIRVLGSDIARSLDTYGTTTSLRRTKIGDYKVDKALSSTKIKEMSREDIHKLIIKDL